MLYHGADLIRDVEWVIFDEVHYVNDPERGGRCVELSCCGLVWASLRSENDLQKYRYLSRIYREILSLGPQKLYM